MEFFSDPKDDLPRYTGADLASLVGVKPVTVRQWRSRYDSFPESSEDDTVVARDFVLWWVATRAPKKLKSALCDTLLEQLKREAEAEALAAAPPEDPIQQQKDLLDLRAKAAKVERELRELVRIDDIRSVMQWFCAKLSEGMRSIEESTGQPATGVIEPIFDELYEHLDAMQQGKPKPLV